MRATKIEVYPSKPTLLTPVIAGLILAIFLFAARVSAVPLPPGSNIPAAPTAGPLGGTILASTLDSFSGPALIGSVTSTVIVNDAANPFGPGSLTFTYLVTLNSTSPQDLSAFAVNSYGSVLVDAGFQVPLAPGAVPPSNMLRSSGMGDTITFQWLTGGGLAPGATSALLVLETSATAFQTTTGGVIDDTPVDLNNLLAPLVTPTAVPDTTGTAALLAAGLGALFIFRRCQSKPAMATI